MTYTWDRDLAVLVAAAEHLEQDGSSIESWRLARQAEMSPEDVERALRVLIPTYLQGKSEGRMAGPADTYITGITEDGLRAAGQWPKRENHLAALIAALTQAVEETDDADERTRLQKMLDAVKGAPQRITEQIVAGVVAGQIGGM